MEEKEKKIKHFLYTSYKRILQSFKKKRHYIIVLNKRHRFFFCKQTTLFSFRFFPATTLPSNAKNGGFFE